MGFTSNFEPFESALPQLARLGRQAEESFARGPDWYPHAVMDLRILAETTQRQLSGKVPSGSIFGDAVIRLREQGTLTPMEANALQQLWRTGSSAAHGERSFDRSEVITAFGLALLVCRFALLRAGKGPVPEAGFRAPPPADEEIRKLQAKLREVQTHASGERAERLQVEERRREFEELARQFADRASEAEQKITEQSAMLEAARGKLTELEGQVRDEDFARQEIERHQQLAADLDRELEDARRGAEEARKGAEDARQRVELGADAYQLDYPRDDWMRIPEFFAQLVRDGDGPFQGYAHVKLCGEGAFGVVHRIAPLGGGSPVVVKLPRKPSDPEDAERLARDWERELQRWRLLDRCRMAPAGVVRVQRISPLGYPAWVRLELIDGEPLGEWAGSRGCPDPVQGLRIMRELARRLDALGNVGFGYTDLHQGNVLVREESGVLQPVLIDAGAATPRLQPPEWRGLRLRDLTTERGGPTERLVRGLAWLLARLTCLTLLGSEVADVVTAGSEDDSLAHLEVGTPPTRAADGPPEIELRRMLNRRFGAHGSEHIDTTLVADLILRGLSSDPSRRPEGPAQFAEFVGLCFRSS